VPLDELVGEALVVRVPGLVDGEIYDWSRLEEAGPLPQSLPPIVIIDTGWARWFGDERRNRHPALAPSAARELVRRGMRVLAVDTLSPDPTGGEAFPVHEAVLGADRLIVENLRGLEGLPSRVVVGFFALALGGDGAPVRAVAFL
jgi:kynurenine formamidase